MNKNELKAIINNGVVDYESQRIINHKLKLHTKLNYQFTGCQNKAIERAIKLFKIIENENTIINSTNP